MRFQLFSLIVGIVQCEKPQVGYNQARQSFVVRPLGPKVYQVMYGPMNNCEEFYLFKDFGDMDSLVQSTRLTNIVSCTEPEGASGVVEAYDIRAVVACSNSVSRRSMAIDCMIGDSPFGGFVIYLDSQPGCEIENATARCGGAFIKYRELTKVEDDSEESISESEPSSDQIDSSLLMPESGETPEQGEVSNESDDSSSTSETSTPIASDHIPTVDETVEAVGNITDSL